MTVKSVLKKSVGLGGGMVKAWVIASLVVLGVHWLAVIAFLVPRLGRLDFLIIHYTVAYGADWHAPWYYIFLFPVLGMAMLYVNWKMAGRLAMRRRVFAELIVQITFMIQLGLAAAGVIAILLNA